LQKSIEYHDQFSHQFGKKEDLRLFEELAKRLGLSFFKISEEEQRFLSRKTLVEKMVPPSNIAVPQDLLIEVVEEERGTRYGKK
jgi:hypothetical protein